jgi:hypothetical protein
MVEKLLTGLQRFLGLFDTVNSVPRFENAMMKRALMPVRS